ncbi:MAG: hypothetical protein JSW23_11805 [Planctomycetota bacterium]|nr:MAG: hypothetical protein JSW23_11805 [Planctomycetota bacterium]
MGRKPNLVPCCAAILVTSIFLSYPGEVCGGMAVSPLQQWVTVKPRQDTAVSLTVTNNYRGPETLPCTVQLVVVDFMVSREGRLSFVTDERHSRSAVDWLTFENGTFVLEPGESRKLEGRVSVPAEADGDYWAAVLVKLVNSNKQQEGVHVNLQTASGIFIHVARRNYVERGSIIDANVVAPKFGQEEGFGEVAIPEQAGREAQQEQALRINAELENEGLVAFLANGKAFVYSENWRRIASIPMYTNRRRIFPTHNRTFTGVMSEPLPAGSYKVRLVFEPVSSRNGSSTAVSGRKITKDIDLTIGEELAEKWAEKAIVQETEILQLIPEELEITLTAGRFTTKTFQAVSQTLSTVSVRCQIEADGQLKDWVALRSADFALAANTKRSVLCWVRIPVDAEPGRYSGTISVEAERSGLTAQAAANVETQKIPIAVVIPEPDKLVAVK